MNTLTHTVKPKVGVLIIDDSRTFCLGLKAQIEQIPSHFEVVGIVVNSSEALLMIKSLTPQIVILDLKMPKVSGFKILEQIRLQGLPTKVILLSSASKEDEDFPPNARPDDILMKGTSRRHLMRTLAQAVNESSSEVDIVFDDAAFPGLSEVIRSKQNQRLPKEQEGSNYNSYGLTAKEREVLIGISKSQDNAAIGETMNISSATVATHITNIANKFDLPKDKPRTRTALAMFALRNGIIT